VESIDVAYSYVLRLGPEAEVLEPPALRDRLAAAAERMRALYR
jgi:predicted DNA-binding transcriptional regulator YafY